MALRETSISGKKTSNLNGRAGNEPGAPTSCPPRWTRSWAGPGSSYFGLVRYGCGCAWGGAGTGSLRTGGTAVGVGMRNGSAFGSVEEEVPGIAAGVGSDGSPRGRLGRDAAADEEVVGGGRAVRGRAGDLGTGIAAEVGAAALVSGSVH